MSSESLRPCHRQSPEQYCLAPGLHSFLCESLSKKKLDGKTHSHLQWVDRSFLGDLRKTVQLGPGEDTRVGGLSRAPLDQGGAGPGTPQKQGWISWAQAWARSTEGLRAVCEQLIHVGDKQKCLNHFKKQKQRFWVSFQPD